MCKQQSAARLFIAIVAVWAVGFQTYPADAQLADFAAEAQASRDQLVDAIAHIDGAVLRDNLLNSADSEQLAHWYAGEVRVGDQWLTLTQAEQQAAGDKVFSAYAELRSNAPDRLVNHERLARWCAKRKLNDLAKVHWMHVLRFDNQHRAALAELDLTWHSGWLMTSSEAENYKRRETEWNKQKKTWQARVKRWRRHIERGEPAEQVAARQELRQVREPEALPALLDELGEPAADEATTLERRGELVAALGRIDSPAAVETLAQVAVEAADESLRYAAIDQLKRRPLESYFPALLAGMAMPVEASVNINSVGNRVVNTYSYSQEKPGGQRYSEDRYSYKRVPGHRYRPVRLYVRGDWVPEKRIPGRTYRVPINPGHGAGLVANECGGLSRVYGDAYLREVTTPDRKVPGHYKKIPTGIGFAEDPAYAAREAGVKREMQREAVRVENALDQHNFQTELQNERIAAVLVEVTGEQLNAFPKSWWNWWSDYLDQNPDVATAGTRLQLNMALLNQQDRGLARGTHVWTRLGKRPVQEVLPGDFVLAQNPQTGELSYKVVLAINGSPALRVSKVAVGDSEFFCAPDHVVWATGSGWQRVSNLTASDSLHGTATEVRITDIGESFEIDCYDLIVDEFHTLFVGEQGVLVHDATPIAPAPAALPGFSPAAVADAAKIVAVAR